MLYSLAMIFLCGLMCGEICKRLHLPPLVGMIGAGILLGPSVLDVLDGSLLGISAQLRRIALIIILMRAGLNLRADELKKVGRPAFLMCFVPATCEMLGTLLFAPLIFGISLKEAAVLGAVLAAVSPAVVVPAMLRLMEKKCGTAQGIPQMITAGASADDVYVIVLFSSFAGIASGSGFSASQLLRIPTSIVFGAAGGILCGLMIGYIAERFRVRDSVIVVITMSAAFLLVTAEDNITGNIGFSGLIAVMAAGMTLNFRHGDSAKAVSEHYTRLWTAAEIILFVLVGAATDIGYAAESGLKAVLLIFGALVFRMAGVFICVLGTKLKFRERIFCMLAYCPKATVQAAIGSVPLSMGLGCGKLVLTVSVVAILLTAPLGAAAIELTHRHLLSSEKTGTQNTNI